MASSKPETDRAERNAVKAPITGEDSKPAKQVSTKRLSVSAADAERARRKAVREAGQAVEDAHDDDSDIISGAVPEQTPPNPGGGVADTAKAEGNVEINTSGAVYEQSFPDERPKDENTTGTVKSVIAADANIPVKK